MSKTYRHQPTADHVGHRLAKVRRDLRDLRATQTNLRGSARVQS